MKKMLNLFSRTGNARPARASAGGFREPTLYGGQVSAPGPAPAAPRMPPREQEAAPREELDVPLDYPGIVAFFQKTVAQRKSPFNALVQAAEQLREFIPDEISRLKAAYALCGAQWSTEALALAIHHHITDIDSVCTKVKNAKGGRGGERARQLRAESSELTRQNVALQAEIDATKARLAELQARFNSNQSVITELSQQTQLIEGDANSVAFLEQAAENLKNDLLAKKALLGLN